MVLGHVFEGLRDRPLVPVLPGQKVSPGGVVAVKLFVDRIHQGRHERSENGGGGVNRSHVLRTEAHELGQVLEAVAEVGLQALFVDRESSGGSTVSGLTADGQGGIIGQRYPIIG